MREVAVSFAFRMKRRCCMCCVNLCRWHIRKVRDEQVEVGWVTWGARPNEWLGEISVNEGDSRANAGAQRVGARDGERLARDVSCGQA
jgi:hypothetical protein